MIVRSKEELKILREGGKKLGHIISTIVEKVSPGVRAADLEELSLRLIEKEGGKPAFLGYTPHGAKRPYPASLCVSLNDEIVHGIPNEEDKTIREGDLVGLDIGLIYEGLVTDVAVTVGAGKIDQSAEKLLKATREALNLAIREAGPGVKVGLLGSVVENHVKGYGFSPADELGGHGLGRSVHEDPFIPNIGPKTRGPALKENEVIAIEPIINEGDPEILLSEDGYTFLTADGKRSAQFEHTVIIKKDGAEILTVNSI